MGKDQEKLVGDELASYVEDHRGEFNKNGDAICMAAGYVIRESDGTEKCNFTDFVKALSSSAETKNEDNPKEGIH